MPSELPSRKNQRIDETVDLTNCDREPIHIPGAIQGFAALIGVSGDWIVTHLSQNVGDMLEIDDIQVGHPLTSSLPAELLHEMRTRMQVGGPTETSVRVFDQPVKPSGRPFDISVSRSGSGLIIEFEPSAVEKGATGLAFVQNLMSRISSESDRKVMYRRAVQGIRAMTGFDRVMLYKFEPDESGQVVAEACDPNVESYLGLHFPASDIPKQARALYLRSVLRIIGDVNAETVPVEPVADAYGNPLDLSFSVSRAVSPIHLEYLRNMGVEASMSISIILSGKLWGLFACHHTSPRHLDFRVRTTAELFAQLFTYEIAQRDAEAGRTYEQEAARLHQSIVSRAASGDLIKTFETLKDEIAEVIAFDGIAMFSDDRYVAAGSAPSETEFRALARFLNTTKSGRIYATNNISSIPNAELIEDRVAGLLALPISRHPRDYVVLFRREIVKQVHWAGNPTKPVIAEDGGKRLSPRKSFALWQEIVKGQSAPWTEPEMRVAESIRVTLLEVILKLSDEANAERARAQEQQELLIAELNHRVRNILNLIRGLVTRSAKGAKDVASLTETMGQRIHALARAHDQLTQTDWGVSSLRNLIDVEIQAFVSDSADRIGISGPDVGVTSDAFSTLALVIHEMVTNCVKYGALSSESGTLKINLSTNDAGNLVIEWKERGGPPVKPSERRGFGSSIIEISIPHELGGEADLRKKPNGVEATFIVPGRYIAPPPDAEAAPIRVHEGGDESSSDAVPESVLLLEDNAIIAMDVSAHLEDAGVKKVHTVARISEALSRLEQMTPDAAVLDVNLGRETSTPVAEVLTEKGVPFILVTGYAGEPVILKEFPTTPVVKKPFRPEELLAALRRAVAAVG